MIVLALLAAPLSTSRGQAPGEAGTTAIETAPPAFHWAMDPETGRLFASVPDEGEVVEFDPGTGKRLRSIPVRWGPGVMAVKGSVLVVACSAPALLVPVGLDGEGETPGRPIPMPDPPFALFCSEGPNPFVYALCAPGSSFDRTLLVRVDLEEGSVEARPARGWGVASLQHRGVDSPRHAVMAPDGRSVAVDSRDVFSSGVAALLEADEERFGFRVEVDEVHRLTGLPFGPFGPIRASPGGRYWTLGKHLVARHPAIPTGRSEAGPASIRRFEGEPVAIHPTLDLAASIDFGPEPPGVKVEAPFVVGASTWEGPAPGCRVAFQRFSDAGILAFRPVGPLGGFPGIDREDPRWLALPEPTLTFDPARGRLLCAWGDRAVVLGLDEMGLDPGPSPIVLRAPPPEILLEGGDRLALPLETVVPEQAGRVALRVSRGPGGARIEDGVLTWDPGSSWYGSRAFTIGATLDGSIADEVSFRVRRDPPTLGISEISGFSVSPDGGRAVAWGPPSPGPGAGAIPADGLQGPGPGSDLVLVDLDGPRVLSRHHEPNGIVAAAVDDRAAYYAAGAGSVLYRLEGDRLDRPGRVFQKKTPFELVALPGGRLAAPRLSEGPGGLLLDPETLRPVPLLGGGGPDVPEGAAGQEFLGGWEALEGGFVRLGPVVLSPDGSIRCLAHPGPFPRLGPTLGPSGDGDEHESRWGRSVSASSLLRDRTDPSSGSTVGEVIRDWGSSAAATLLIDRPMAAVASIPQGGLPSARFDLDFPDDPGGRPFSSWKSLELGFLELVEGRELDRRSIRFRVGVWGHEGPRLVPTSRGELVVAWGDRLQVVSPPETPGGPGGGPSAIVLDWPSAPIAIPLDAETRIAMTARGGSGRLTFDEAGPGVPGVSVDPGSGQVTIDGPRLREGIPDVGFADSATAGYLLEAFDGRAEAIRAEYRGLVGEAPAEGTIPLGLVLCVGATDEERQYVERQFALLLQVPREDLERIAEEDRRAEERRIAEWERQQADSRRSEAERLELEARALQQRAERRRPEGQRPDRERSLALRSALLGAIVGGLLVAGAIVTLLLVRERRLGRKPTSPPADDLLDPLP